MNRYSNDTQFMNDFVDVILSFTQEEREKLMLFITGQRKLDVRWMNWL